MHYIVIAIIVGIILTLQLRVFFQTKKRIAVFKNIFPSGEEWYNFSDKVILKASPQELVSMLEKKDMNIDSFFRLNEVELFRKSQKIESLPFTFLGEEKLYFDCDLARKKLLKDLSDSKAIYTEYKNPVLNDIFSAINGYLQKNKAAVSDFHLMKDIVDRNCDATDDEISTQIPFPLYFGLMGTMFGIIIGVGYLWISGDLNGLLSMHDDISSTNGIVTLLGGVALAMIASAMGIILTVRGSSLHKDARLHTEHNKHIFLSWIQTNLLPALNNDTAQTLEKMSRNLVEFNNSFSDNTKKLGIALNKVNETTALQKQLLDAVGSIADKNISQQNIKLLNALNASAENVSHLAECLNNSATYLRTVKELNEKLDKGERRAEAIEKMVDFFQQETTQIEQRKAAMTHAVGLIDSEFEERMRKLTEHAEQNVKNFSLALGRQQDALQKKLDETSVVIDEIHNLKSIKSSIERFEKATQLQNSKLDNLANSIRQLAQSKSNEVIIPEVYNPNPKKTKKQILIACSACLGFLLLLFIIANWDSIYSFIIDLFQI